MNPDLYQELVKQINSLQKQVDGLIKPEVPNPLSLFSAFLSASALNVTGDGTNYAFICDTEISDLLGDYNNGTGVFTAPVTGKYLFIVEVRLAGILSTHTWGALTLVTTNRIYYLRDINCYNIFASNSLEGIGYAVIADMSAGHTAYPTVSVNGGTKVVDVGGNVNNPVTLFQGFSIR